MDDSNGNIVRDEDVYFVIYVGVVRLVGIFFFRILEMELYWKVEFGLGENGLLVGRLWVVVCVRVLDLGGDWSIRKLGKLR